MGELDNDAKKEKERGKGDSEESTLNNLSLRIASFHSALLFMLYEKDQFSQKSPRRHLCGILRFSGFFFNGWLRHERKRQPFVCFSAASVAGLVRHAAFT